MAENKTKETDADVSAFVAAVSDAAQRADTLAIIAMMEKASGHPPKLWGPSIIGFGSYHYKYESGREGDSLRIGLSPRKGKTVLYIMGGFPQHDAILARIGKHQTGKSCLYIKRLSDLDLDALGDLISASLAAMQAKYPE